MKRCDKFIPFVWHPDCIRLVFNEYVMYRVYIAGFILGVIEGVVMMIHRNESIKNK